MVSQTSEPIAIVGSSCRFPGGANTPSKLWKLLESPRDVSQEIPADRFDTTGWYHPDGGHHGTTNVTRAYLLQESLKVFDAAFFNISPNEADSIDPQQRLLLETVYEALEAGGHTIEGLKGSDTAVYAGTMGVDYYDTLLRDVNNMPTYFATGTNRAILSNRVSYFFDWHGPSMTIDTACSSSLIAMHQGVQTLRTGESRVAVACGSNVILNPDAFVFESKLNMLSPTGRSQMWSDSADGYARGEGVAAVILKRLSDAIADGDHIECLIRETGANQDGHSNGITVPSSEAQAALIRKTYANAGLDPENNPNDRPQYFEAHGTGTKAGDPKEAAAVHGCFGRLCTDDAPLYVGSVKTVIGHLEGTAGLAGVLKASAAIQHGFIPPNLLFGKLNPAIEPFYKGLHVPTTLTPWPKLAEGVPRRVSVNSFGFGGSNAHAILEEYRPEPASTVLVKAEAQTTPFTPFIFSAVSEGSLLAQLKVYSEYLKADNTINASDLAYTLQSRRSQLPVKTAFSASTIEQLVSKIDNKLAEVEKIPGSSIGVRTGSKSTTPLVLGVFTGQGAQWASMGAQLIRSSDFVRARVQNLEESLADLPPSDRPKWSLKDEMLAGFDTSRIAEAELSQPLCTAIQIVLVDLLQTAGITFSAVVGHSSGEIAAAYAAGFFSAHDAIRIAYYRGLYARLAGSSGSDVKGSMLAVGTSLEDAQELINLRTFKGRLSVAAHNSSASVTLSGDGDAIILAKKIFDEEKKFARLLKVDTAYHSHHMLPCGDPYIQAMRDCKIRVNRERSHTSCSWFSSVTPSARAMEPIEELQDTYWRDNMTNAVLFADAVSYAVSSNQDLTFAIEVGPHPALKGPATQNISEVRPASLPYCGVLSRGQNDVEAFSEALGFVWTNFGAQGVNFQSYEMAVSSLPGMGCAAKSNLTIGLPSYQWNHNRVHWHESRKSRKYGARGQDFHEVLGVLSLESTDRDMRWTNMLKPSEISWLSGHQLQGQMVFPAAGYVAMSLEAARLIAADRTVETFELENLSIPKAITFEEDANASVETLVTMTTITTTGPKDHQTATADFSCYSCSSGDDMELMASGVVKIVFGTPSIEALSSIPLDTSNMANVDEDRFYESLQKLGYGYTNAFRAMSSLNRRLNQSSSLISTYPYTEADPNVYLVHPTWLDVAFQASFLAYSAPGDDRLWALHVPTSIQSIRINPELCASLPMSGAKVPCCAVLNDSDDFCASIDIFSEDSQQTMMQIQDLLIRPFAPATKDDDHRLFLYTKYGCATPDGKSVVRGIRPSAEEKEIGSVCERVSYHYLRKWKSELSEEDWVNGQPHHPSLRDFMNYTLSNVSSGKNTFVKKEWSKDSEEDIKALIAKYPKDINVRLISAVGENIPAAVRGETTILEHMLPDNMLDDFYKQGLGFARYNSFLASMMSQMTHRYPHAKILEIGAGTGGATKSILESIGNTMSSYTYTDVSIGFFEKAAELFKAYSDKMTFKVLDIEKAPATQGYESHSYDFIIASNVLHATESLQKTLENTRQLLKPGGYLMLLEVTDNRPIRSGCIMGGLSGWWVGAGDGRKYTPTITPGQWHTALRKAGFSGVEAITPEIDGIPWPFSVMAAQAVDDRVQFLRRPLSGSASSSSIYLDSVVILGTGSLESARIAEEISDHLSNFTSQVTVLNGLPTEDEALTLNPMSTFINLVDLDSPIFKEMTEEKMDGLKRVFEFAQHILWITLGALADEPYHMASIAFGRSLSHEFKHINLSHLDLSSLDHNTSKVITEHLLRQCALDEWEHSNDASQQLLWSKEPEVFFEKGQLMIPRIVANRDQNSRLNSSRRTITKTVPISSTKVTIETSADSAPALVEEVLSEVLPPALQEAQDNHSPVRVESSSLMALHVAEDTFLFLAVGKDETTKETVAILSSSNSCETNPIASVATAGKDIAQSSDSLLVAIASELLAASLFGTLSSGSSILIHCSSKDRFLVSALSRQAAAKEIRLTFTCDAECTDGSEDSSWIQLSTRASKNSLQKSVAPAKPTHFLDLTANSLSHSSDLSLSIAQVLPSGYKQINASDLSRHESLLPLTQCDTEVLNSQLEDAVSNAGTVAASIAQEQVQDLVIQLAEIRGPSSPNHTMSVVHWALEGNVKIEVHPLDATRLFSEDKSYLLVGLTGQIGQSLCEWMISNGAGCVCLTSRNPNISESWLESFDGKVKIFSLDITDKENLERVVADIRASSPPIGGIANGAMVLHDSMFSGMDLETMTGVLGPKIDGTNNLDEVFHDDDLDFFVLFSSAACQIGNAGQSNYSAANGFLNSFVRQRRKRGLAASAFDIGRVAGIGYVETAGQFIVDQLDRFGFMAICETEFHAMFAETIETGYPRPEDKDGIPEAVVTTGIRTIRDDEECPGPWFENPRFCHSIIEAKKEISTSEGGLQKSAPVKEQLAGAVSTEQALEILQDCFAASLRVILQISDQAVDHDAPLVELGVDSLVAVEVRSWFLKELKVDIPVLKVVGGASVADLCQRALEKLPEELLSSIGKGGNAAKPEARKPAPIAVQPQSESKATDSSASSQSPTSSMGSQTQSPTLSSSTQPSSRPISPENLTDSAKVSTISPKSSKSSTPTPATVKQPLRRFLKSEQISFGQSRFWFLQHLLEDPTAFNVAFYYQVTGTLRIGDLERAIQVVTARHEMLRTCFIADETEGDQAFQKVMNSSPLRLEQKKIHSVEDVADEYAKLKAHVFDPASGDLIKLVLLTISPSSHYLLINYHHIMMDGVSFQVLISDLEKAYKRQPLGASPRQFIDFSAAQRQAYEKGEMKDELKYWRGVFPAGEQPPVLPLLPMARTSSRVSTKNFAVHEVVCRLEPALAARVKSMSRSQRSTPFHFYLAAFKAMLFSFTDTKDLTIGIADANRSDIDVMGSIGFFLNLLTLRFRRQEEQRFGDAVTEARNTIYAALENSRLPFDVLLKELNVARSSSHSPFFQAFFDYRQGAQEKHAFGNCQFEVKEIHPGRTAYDITMDVTESPEGSIVICRTQSSLYDKAAANLLLNTYTHLLDVLSSDVSLSLKNTPLFSEKQLTQAIGLGRGPHLKSDWPATLPHRIDQVAEKNGDKVALMDDEKSLTYSDMTARIESIAEALQKAGVSSGSRVLVFQQATADWVCSMLAIMRLGGLYVPLDLRNPLPRLAAVATDCQPKSVLTDDTTFDDAKQLKVPDATIINVSLLAMESSARIPNNAQSDAPAAILYTSGSTGTPKGITVKHSGLRNEIEGYTKMWKLGSERVLQQSAFTFNHSSDQIYTGLVNGGMVYVVPWSKRGDPLEITKIMREQSITYTKATPSEYSMWMQFGGENLRQASKWRFAFGGGESMTSNVMQEFASLGLPQLRLFNSYGPTEISISSTKMEIAYREKPQEGRIPCGFSLPNYVIYILDEKLKPLPAGMAGEMYIGGAGVSLGYLHNKELTDQHFVVDPYATPEYVANGWTRMYRTGDIGHLLNDGAMVFHNRIAGDEQVKIRGLRIELSDIESNIISTADGALRDAVVTLHEGDPEFLVAHVVFAPQHNIAEKNKESFLQNLISRLPVPQYMKPVIAIPLHQLPLTNHSKVDRKAVKNMPLPKQARGGEEDVELTETMMQLKRVWRDVLGNNKDLDFEITPSTSFFLVGGNSLLVIRLQSRIRQIFNVVVRLYELLGANTLGEMARKIEESSSIELIDWNEETAPPAIPGFLGKQSEVRSDQQKLKTVLVTGGAGYLAKYILPQLAANGDVGRIHCVAIRDKPTERPRKLPSSSKIISHEGDLSAPLLGLSEDEFRTLSSQVDVILHMGAVRSFWDNYHAIRPSNVHPTKELVKLAAPRHIPIHYISSVGVLPQGPIGVAKSSADNIPAVDGSNGYVASRWASERILERSASDLGIPSYVYRFLPSTQQTSSQQVLDELVRYVDMSSAIPDFSSWEGRIDMVPAEKAANWLCESILEQCSQSAATKFSHYESPVAINVADMRAHIEEKRGDRGLELMPGLRWVHRIKELGFDYHFSSQAATVKGSAGGGAKFESRR